MEEICSICVANLKNKQKWDTNANTVEDLETNVREDLTIMEKAPIMESAL